MQIQIADRVTLDCLLNQARALFAPDLLILFVAFFAYRQMQIAAELLKYEWIS